MVNKVLDATTRQLGTTFGTNYHYYVENVEQGLITPCFTVAMLEPRQRSKSPVLYDRTMPLVIHYFNDNQESINKDCYAIAEQVVDCLEYLPFEGTLLRGENISWTIVEDVLQIFVTYTFSTVKVVEDVEMETLEHSEVNPQ